MTFSPVNSPSACTRRAFTLLELLTVVAIIAVLASVVAGTARRAVESGRIARARSELAVLSGALETYRRDYGDYPQTDDAARLLQSLLGRIGPTNALLLDRALIDVGGFTTSAALDPVADPSAVLLDPWGQPYVYVYKVPPGGWTNPSFVLYSIGPDGHGTPGLLPGGTCDPSLPGNADNIYANRD